MNYLSNGSCHIEYNVVIKGIIFMSEKINLFYKYVFININNYIIKGK